MSAVGRWQMADVAVVFMLSIFLRPKGSQIHQKLAHVFMISIFLRPKGSQIHQKLALHSVLSKNYEIIRTQSIRMPHS